jgi:hypothetical protein
MTSYVGRGPCNEPVAPVQMLLMSVYVWLQEDRIVERDVETDSGVQLLVGTAHSVPKLDETMVLDGNM